VTFAALPSEAAAHARLDPGIHVFDPAAMASVAPLLEAMHYGAPRKPHRKKRKRD
jgi:hypothetical protein